jgi:small subunit ribosomal protein S15
VAQKEKKELAPKTAVIDGFKQHDSDTGSPEVQVALITKRIDYLQEHFKTHKKDHHSRRGLIMLVAKRKNLLAYLQKNELTRYREIIAALGLRK